MSTIYISKFIETEKKKYQTQHNAGLRLLSHALAEDKQIYLSQQELALQLKTGSHGKPFLESHPEVHFNISHCDDMVACVLDSAPVGVDIEIIKPFSELMIRKVLTEDEQAFLTQMSTDEHSHNEWFFRFWTLKESRIKQSGLGLSMPLTDFSFYFDLAENPYEITCSDKNLFFRQHMLEERYLLSLCTTTKKAVSIKYVELSKVIGQVFPA